MKEKCKNCGDPIPLHYTQVGGVHMYCEHEYFHEKNVRMIRMRPGKGYPYAVVTPIEAEGLIKDMSPHEDGYHLEVVMMSKGEVENLKEFTGW